MKLKQIFLEKIKKHEKRPHLLEKFICGIEQLEGESVWLRFSSADQIISDYYKFVSFYEKFLS